jgi:hypothetical protein
MPKSAAKINELHPKFPDVKAYVGSIDKPKRQSQKTTTPKAFAECIKANINCHLSFQCNNKACYFAAKNNIISFNGTESTFNINTGYCNHPILGEIRPYLREYLLLCIAEYCEKIKLTSRQDQNGVEISIANVKKPIFVKAYSQYILSSTLQEPTKLLDYNITQLITQIDKEVKFAMKSCTIMLA